MFFNKKKEKNQDPAQDANDNDFFMSNVLLVVDGSNNSLTATQFAINYAQKTGCHLLAAFIIDTATMDYLQQMRIFIQDEREDLERDMEQKGVRYLERVKCMAENRNVSIETTLRRGRLHQTILQVARDGKIDAIILAGWKHEIQQKDSTSIERQLILDLADCPVIVVKKKHMHP
ncbi:MAG: universal stress protein [Lentisphaeria bacterium]